MEENLQVKTEEAGVEVDYSPKTPSEYVLEVNNLKKWFNYVIELILF